jgi:5-methylcytosine-specific restriction enzyme A
MARRMGQARNDEWNVNALHALYRENGTWYHLLERFPGALFDANGYILFDREEDYKNCSGVHLGKETTVPKGIASLRGYRRVA